MNDLYSHLGQKVIRKKIFSHSRAAAKPTSIEEMRNNAPWAPNAPEDLIRAFCQELKDLLTLEDLPELIAGIFRIESDLQKFTQQEEFRANSAELIPSFEEFYRQLTPIILRSIADNPVILGDAQQLNKLWKEALRISLEDELYFWQNKIQWR